jgi:flagellar motor switch protein FliM
MPSRRSGRCRRCASTSTGSKPIRAFAAITRPANAAILVRLRIDMEDRGGTIELLLPYATIEPIRDVLLQMFMGEKFGRDPVWEGHLATEIGQAEIAVEAVLYEAELPLRRLMSLDVGDTLPSICGPTPWSACAAAT